MDVHTQISLQAHTLGSIGQVLKDLTDEKAIRIEIKRIYDGYIERLNQLLLQ